MSYISAIRDRDEVRVWERQDGVRELVTYPAPYYFFTPHQDGEYDSIFGQKLMRHDFDTYRDMLRARQECESNNIGMFESDIPPEMKVLTEHYYGKAAPTLNVTLLDIEVDYNREVGFSSIANPYAVINSIAMYHTWEKRMVVYAIPPFETPDKQEFLKQMNEIEPLPTDVDIDITFCTNERELLLYVLAEIEDSDMLCGWNSDFFDVPYIGKRIEKTLGPTYFKRLSFPLAAEPRWREVERFNMPQQVLDLQGRTTTDYLELFRKYEVAERPSYKLESIADEVLPEMPKLQYEGSLADLYRKDFAYFVRYNFRDTEILKGFEDKLGYIALANEMYHISTGLCKHVTGTIKLAELAINNYCINELGVRVPDNIIDDDSAGIEGAYVLVPTVGMHEWVGSMDINSLYPSAIRSINVSPETLVGQFRECERAVEEISKESMVTLSLMIDNREDPVSQTAEEWKKTLTDNKWAISGYGTVFNQEKQGVIPTILEKWYTTRKKYQKMMHEALSAASDIIGEETKIHHVKTAAGENGFDGKEGKGVGDENLVKITKSDNPDWVRLKEQAAYYDRLQYVYKIKLNSLYGALNNRFFRYYDLRMGESTTATGRAILRHMCASVCEVLDGKYQMPNRKVIDKDGKEHWGYEEGLSVVYGDTDSTYFVTHAGSKEEAIIIADAVADKVTDTFQKLMSEKFLCTEGFNDIIKAGREIVANRGIFVDKKRYILNVVDSEGDDYGTGKLKVMGLDTKKTTMPVEVSKRLNDFVGRHLKGEQWDTIASDIVDYKEELETTDNILTIGLPKGVKKVEEYTEQYNIYGDGVRLPGHVAASIHYNKCLKEYDDRDSLPIISGMKIKVFYLTQKYGRFKSIAIPTDAQGVPEWFTEHFTVDRDMHIARLVDNPLNNIIKAIGKETPSRQ